MTAAFIAYWLNLKDWDETENSAYRTVAIPERNVFDVASLRDLMEQSRNGGIQ